MSTKDRVLMIMGLVLAVGLAIQFLYDPLAPYRNQWQKNELQKELNEAEKKWNSQNITDYSFEMEYYSFAPLACGAIITVRKGNVVEVAETMQGGWEKLPQPKPLPKTMWDGDEWDCQYSHFTISEFFNHVQNWINAGGMVNASFDPEFGFVTEYYRDTNISHALGRGWITDSEVSCKVSNFQRLDSSTP